MLGGDGGEFASFLNLPASFRLKATNYINYFPARKRYIYLGVPSKFYHSFKFQSAVPLCSESTIMATMIKGIYKGFKYNISQIFVVKEREMEIGYPTDVKHVAHIGWDGSSGTAPSWMNEFKIGTDLKATSKGNSGVSNPTSLTTWSSQDFEQSMESQPATEMMRNLSCTDLPNITKKQKRKKKSTSTPKSSSTRSSRTSSTKAIYTHLGSTADLEI